MSTNFIDHLLTGDHASRPAFGDVPQGTLYACSDHGLVYQSDGSSAWSTWATLGGSGGAPDDAQYLVGASNGDLTAEIVVTAAGLALLDDADAAAQRATLDLEPGTDIPALSTFNDHSARHEDGGADEISLAGLAGESVTPQPPKAHASTHEDGGSDELEITDLATAETDDTLVLAPDGAGGVEFRAETGGGAALVGLLPRAVPVNYDNSAAYSTALSLPAAGGSVAIAIEVRAPMRLQAVEFRNTDASGARTWGWDLYVQNGETNVLDRVAASNGNESYTATTASIRTLAAGSAPVVLDPGLYWVVIQNRHATQTIGVGTTAASAFQGSASQTKTTSNPNGATLDFTAATWTKNGHVSHAVALIGRVFGESTGF